jgi:hypothetical protein
LPVQLPVIVPWKELSAEVAVPVGVSVCVGASVATVVVMVGVGDLLELQPDSMRMIETNNKAAKIIGTVFLSHFICNLTLKYLSNLNYYILPNI